MHLTMILQLKNKHMTNGVTYRVFMLQCDDVPAPGCIYADGFGYFNEGFGEDACVTYGGTPCPACDDVDEDGVCDDEDDCVGSYDDCGVCNER